MSCDVLHLTQFDMMLLCSNDSDYIRRQVLLLEDNGDDDFNQLEDNYMSDFD